MCAPLLRGDEFLNCVGEENKANLVIVLDGRKRQNGTNLCSDFVLELLCRTELTGPAEINITVSSLSSSNIFTNG